MADTFLSKIFSVKGNDAMREVYDEWASSYDKDILETGYATPVRVAAALKSQLPDTHGQILDFGCGTGLSGQALSEAGFSTIDGVDLSPEMLRAAREKGVYRDLWAAGDDATHDIAPGQYDAITAIGVISYGAAPLSVFDDIFKWLAPGNLFAFSFNDQSLEDGRYEAKVDEYISAGRAELLISEYGPHLTKLGVNSGSKVFVLKCLS